MNNKAILSALMAACLTISSAAFAEPRDRDDGPGRGDRGHNDDRGHDRGRHDDHGRNDRYDYRPRAYNGPRGAGPRHDMRRGGRISNDYRGNQYVVNDWRGHRLSAPPRGSHWVQTGNDYVLVAIASGIIAQVLLSN